MDEDIDIEEHDIMENPRLKNILHFENIKEEPMDYEDNYEEYSYNHYEENEMQEENECSDSDTSVGPMEYCNRITLGTKPNNCNLKFLSVLLEDWGPRLERSSCFCKDCNILFATRNSLDAHNMTAHSFLVAINKTPTESPEESFEDKDTLNQMLDEVEIRQSHKYCNHCQKYFEDDNVLIQHLYELITAKQAKVQGKTIVMNQSAAPAVPTTSEAHENLYKSCPICSFYCKFNKPMKQHLLTCHRSNTTVNDLIPFDPKCKFCPATIYSKRSYNRHVLIRHKSVWSRLNIKEPGQPEVSKDVQNPNQVKCPKCPKVFVSPIAVRVHLYKTHNVRKKTEDKNVLIDFSDVDHGTSKSYLFKCSKCPVHFLTSLQGLAHANKIGAHDKKTRVGYWQCKKCKRTFRAKDQSAHELQHKHNSSFKVLVVHKGLYARVMCKCSKCSVYFEELTFLKHLNQGCVGPAQAEECKICNMSVGNITSHELRHARFKLSKSDFIILDDYVFSNSKSGVVKRITMESSSKFIKECKDSMRGNQKFTLYYCHHCECYSRDAKRRTFHMNAECKSVVSKSHCSVCGLKVSQGLTTALHMVLHESLHLELKDFTFRRMSDLKPFVPPMPKFVLCPKCDVRCVFKRRHSCKLPFKRCSICKKKFNLQTYKLHMLHHKYLKKDLEEPSDTLTMKYDMLKPTWHILFYCSVCHVAFDSYDSVIDHCQKHFSNMESYDAIIHTCYTCSLKFESDSYIKHKELHSNKEITKESFKILSYDYSDLFKLEWFDMLSPLQEGEMNQITSHSIYVTRAVKMKLLVNGPPELTIYKCEICGNIVPSTDILKHAKSFNECAKSIDRYKCKQCSLVFGTKAAKNEHVALHVTEDVTKNSYRVVAFNSVNDKEFNERLLEEFSVNSWPNKVEYADNIKTNKKSRVKPKLPKLKISKVYRAEKRKFRYYQCQKCMCCSMKSPKTNNHVCGQKKFIEQCAKCKYFFAAKGMHRHRTKHEEWKDFTRANINIIPYIGTKVLKKVPKPLALSVVFKCVCGLHFPSKQTIIKHGTECSPNLKISCADCSKCGLSFPTNLLVNHLLNHHSNGDTKLQVFDVPLLFKCKSCKCLFLKRQALSNHQRTCEGNFDGSRCTECDLLFHKSTIAAHMQTHSKKSTKKEELPKMVLYKCERCKIHFPTQELGVKHMRNHYIERSRDCKKCKYTFFVKHLNVHLKEQQCTKADIKIQVLTEKEVKQKESNKKPNSDALTDKAVKQKESNKKRNFDVGNVSVSKRSKKIETVKDETDTSVCDKEETTNTYKESEFLEIIIEGDMSLYRCKKCDVHFCNIKTFDKHKYHHVMKWPIKTCDDCGRRFSKISLTKHKSWHKCKPAQISEPTTVTPEKKPVVPIVSRQSSFESVATTSKQNSYNYKLYKCAECNVHFMNQGTCYKHMLNHRPLDITDFIACKICSLQFRIASLTYHVKTHHATTFDIDKVLVEEYKSVEGGSPKIDIYYAGDKVQSKLVSTTTDDQDESSKKNSDVSDETPRYVDDVIGESKTVGNLVSKSDYIDIKVTNMEVKTSTEKGDGNSLIFDSAEASSEVIADI